MRRAKAELLPLGVNPKNARMVGVSTIKYTRLSHPGGPPEEVVRYHDTDIVVSHSDGSQSLFTGGWPTVTTVRRMNQHITTGHRVYRQNWKLYVVYVPDWERRAAFVEGIRIFPDGSIAILEDE